MRNKLKGFKVFLSVSPEIRINRLKSRNAKNQLKKQLLLKLSSSTNHSDPGIQTFPAVIMKMLAWGIQCSAQNSANPSSRCGNLRNSSSEKYVLIWSGYDWNALPYLIKWNCNQTIPPKCVFIRFVAIVLL